jgi:glutaconate CoA-transferase subunit B
MNRDEMTQPATVDEMLAILLARDLKAADRTIIVGANMPVARAAATFALSRTHQHARIMLGLGWQSRELGAPLPPVRPFTFDPRTLRADSWMRQWNFFDGMHAPDVFFVSGMQVDQRGNINLFGIPDNAGGWIVRGPGGVGTATLTTHAGGYYIVMARHELRTFVDRVALITALGDAQERQRLHLPGGGVRLVVSPLGVFDFDENGDMRVKSLHPGITPEDVRAATGFTLDVPDTPARTDPPTAEELAFLRERVDVDGTLAT